MASFPHSESTTSFDAALQVDANKAAIDRVRIFKFLRQRGNQGAIDEEIADTLSIAGNTVRPRRQELEKAGYIGKSGYRRKTKRNRDASIWVSICDDDPELAKFDERRRKVELIDLAKGEIPSVDIAAGGVRLRLGLSQLKIITRAVTGDDAALHGGMLQLVAELERRRPGGPVKKASKKGLPDWYSFLTES